MTSAVVVGFRTTMFDGELGEEARRAQLARLDRAVERLSGFVTVSAAMLVESGAPPTTSDRIAGLAPDLMILVPLSAVSPSSAAIVPPGVRSVIWDISPGQPLDIETDQSAAHRDTGPIGALMLASGMPTGTHPVIVSESLETRDLSALAAAVAATVAETGPVRILRLGVPVPGYSSLEVSVEQCGSVGIALQEAPVSRLVASLDASSHDPAGRSENLAQALETLVSECGVDAVALNCHSEDFKDGEVGVVACLAASRHVPVACTGDVPTAWLLAIGTKLTGSALYCEPYTLDAEADAIVLANCGIGSRPLCRDGTWSEVPSQFYPGRLGRGTSVAMAVAPGPATVLTAVPEGPRWTVTCTQGEVLDRRLPRFGGAHAYFRPSGTTSREWLAALGSRRSLHHAVLVGGHRRNELSRMPELRSATVVEP